MEEEAEDSVEEEVGLIEAGIVLVLVEEEAEDSVVMASAHRCTRQCVQIVVTTAKCHSARLEIVRSTVRIVSAASLMNVLLVRTVHHLIEVTTVARPRLLPKDQIRLFVNFPRKLTRSHKRLMHLWHSLMI
jgi:hypothetical protein